MSLVSGWTDAEQTVYTKLINATGSEDGVNSFLGEAPTEMVNVWSLDTGGGPADIANGNCYGSEDYNATIQGVFTSREGAQVFCGQIKQLLASDPKNFNGVGNVQWFRPVGNPQITQNLDEQVTVLEWSFELIFNNV